MTKKALLLWGLCLALSGYSQPGKPDASLDSLVVIVSQNLEDIDRDTVQFPIDVQNALEQVKFKPQFKKQYFEDPDLDYQEVQNKTLKSELLRIWRKFKNWLVSELLVAGDNIYKFSMLTKIGFWILILAGLYYIVRSIIKRDLKWIFKRNKPLDMPQISLEAEDIKDVDFQDLIQTALENKQYRLTIRYYYLWLLQLLAHQGYIVWQQEKTNADYLSEIKDPELKKTFRYLSYLYNYIWYGDFTLEHEVFQSAKSSFESTLKRLKK